jgi:pyruvate dehydrogenase (quinone)
LAKTVADFILERLRDWGIHTVFGYPGGGTDAFLGAFDRAGGDPAFVQSRHEEMSAFQACGYAKFSQARSIC